MDKQKDTKKEKKIYKANTDANAGPPDTACLCYPLDVESVTLETSLLPASTRYKNK